MFENQIRVLAVILGLGGLITIAATGDLDVETLSLNLPSPVANVVMTTLAENALHPAYQANWKMCESLPSWGGINIAVEETVANLLTGSFELADKLVR